MKSGSVAGSAKKTKRVTAAGLQKRARNAPAKEQAEAQKVLQTLKRGNTQKEEGWGSLMASDHTAATESEQEISASVFMETLLTEVVDSMCEQLKLVPNSMDVNGWQSIHNAALVAVSE